MLTHIPQLQFVTGLPDSPKTKAKGVVLVKGPWYEILGSLRHLFDLNQSLVFLGLSQLCCSFVHPPSCPCFDIAYLFEFFIGKRRRGRLVS